MSLSSWSTLKSSLVFFATYTVWAGVRGVVVDLKLLSGNRVHDLEPLLRVIPGPDGGAVVLILPLHNNVVRGVTVHAVLNRGVKLVPGKRKIFFLKI